MDVNGHGISVDTVSRLLYEGHANINVYSHSSRDNWMSLVVCRRICA